MRVPRPVLMKPRANMKATMMSQRVFSAKPLRLSATFRVPVMAVSATPMMATAPMGRGRRMIPRMVATKMAKRCRPRIQSAWRSFSASALALASPSAFTLASVSALALAAASNLALASASAFSTACSRLDGAAFLAAGFAGVGFAASAAAGFAALSAAGFVASPGLIVLSAAGLAFLSPGFAPLSAGLAEAFAVAVPPKIFASGMGAKRGRTKYRRQPTARVTKSCRGLAPCHPPILGSGFDMLLPARKGRETGVKVRFQSFGRDHSVASNRGNQYRRAWHFSRPGGRQDFTHKVLPPQGDQQLDGPRILPAA